MNGYKSFDMYIMPGVYPFLMNIVFAIGFVAMNECT